MLKNIPLAAVFIAIASLLAACTYTFPPPGGAPSDARQDTLSCSEIARRQAESQYSADTSALDQRESSALGGGGDVDVQRDLAEMDAEARYRKLYKDCLRHRGLPEEGEGEPAQ